MNIDNLGIYGKLPSYADFVTSKLDAEVTQFWYDWIQSAIFHSKKDLEESEWLTLYLISPPWRFYLSEKVLGSGPMIGVVVPSVDRVGRYFPVILGISMNEKDKTGEWLFSEGREVLDLLERAGIKALQEKWSLEDIVEWVSSEELEVNEGELSDKLTPSSHYEIDILNDLDSSIDALEIGTVWWNSFNENSLSVFEEMPAPQVYQFMLGKSEESSTK